MNLLRGLPLALLSLSSLVSTPASAHPGGLNSEGCHNNRKTGDYHCHGAPRAAPPPRPRPPEQSGAPLRAFGGPVVFANCSEARATGAAPVRRGDPGYSPRLDRDGDGVACE